jgi:hypothetical protein
MHIWIAFRARGCHRNSDRSRPSEWMTAGRANPAVAGRGIVGHILPRLGSLGPAKEARRDARGRSTPILHNPPPTAPLNNAATRLSSFDVHFPFFTLSI